MSSSRGRCVTLILVGHGASGHPDSGKPLYACADVLRRVEGITRVVPVFWRESVSYWTALLALSQMELGEVVVVPFFMADGYFSRVILNDFFGLHAPLRRLCTASSWQITPPVGVDDRFVDVALFALDRWETSAERRRHAALLLVGHGTRRHNASGGSTQALADALRERVEMASMHVCFLDQEPTVEEVLERVEEDEVVVLPVFTANGFHTRSQLPELAGLEGGSGAFALPVRGVDRVRGRRVYVASALGTSTAVHALVQERVCDVLGLEVGGVARGEEEERWERWLWDRGGVGELALRDEPRGAYVCNIADRAHALESLVEVGTSLEKLRRTARNGEGGDVRQVPELRGLRRGWVSGPWKYGELLDAVSAVYPSWFWSQVAASAPKEARARFWAEVCGVLRGSRGRLKDNPQGFEDAQHTACESCVLVPVWGRRASSQMGSRCALPCSVVLDAWLERGSGRTTE